MCVFVCTQDVQIEKEKGAYNISGGCTALVVICLQGKLYVGNAGDSRCDSHTRTHRMSVSHVLLTDVSCCALCVCLLLSFSCPSSSRSKRVSHPPPPPFNKQSFVCSSLSELSLFGLEKSFPCQRSSPQSQRDSDCSSW